MSRKEIIGLRGLETNSDPTLVKDGGMDELVNLKKTEDGRLSIVGGLTVACNLGMGVHPLYIHSLPNGKSVLISAIDSSTDSRRCSLVASHEKLSSDTTWKEKSTKRLIKADADSVEVYNAKFYGSGNLLTISYSESIEYYLHSDDEYIFQFIPSSPCIKVTEKKYFYNEIVVRDPSYLELGTITAQKQRDGAGSIGRSSNGNIIIVQGNRGFPQGDLSDYLGFIKMHVSNGTNEMYERVLFIAVVRLFDGSYIASSNIEEVGFPGGGEVSMRLFDDKKAQLKSMAFRMPRMSFSLEASIETKGYEEKHLQLISSVDVFAYKFDPYAQPQLTDRDTIDGAVVMYNPVYSVKASKDGKEILSDANGFYYIGSGKKEKGFVFTTSTNDKKSNFKLHNRHENPLFREADLFVQQEALDWSKLSPVSTLIGDRYHFNRKSHLYNIKEFYKVSEVLTPFVSTSDLEVISAVWYRVYIVTQDNITISVGNTKWLDERVFANLYTPIFGIQKIIVEKVRLGIVVSRWDIPLNKHSYMPISFCCCSTLEAISDDDVKFDQLVTPRETGINKPSQLYTWSKGLTSLFSTPLHSNYKSPESKSFYERLNVLKVSEIDNPISFTASRTYGYSGRVLALSTMVSAPEEYHFGTYPLYVFTSKGVVAMQQGDGSVYYSGTVFVSSDVIDSPRGIVDTPHGVCFVSNGQVYVMRNGREKISTLVEGNSGHTDFYDKTIQAVYEEYFSHITWKNELLSKPIPFAKYVEGCELYYSYRHDEVVAINNLHRKISFEEGEKSFYTGLPYCYVFDFKALSWYKRTIPYTEYYTQIGGGKDISVSNYLQDGGAFFLSNKTDSKSVLYSWDNRDGSPSNILAITRPVSFGDTNLNRVEQVALRAFILSVLKDVTHNDAIVTYENWVVGYKGSLSFYILGSQDGVVWRAIGGKRDIGDMRDVVVGLNRSNAHRYYSFAIVGASNSGTYFNAMEVVVSDGFNNRLR